MSASSDPFSDAPLKTETVVDPHAAAAPKPLSTAVLVLGFIVCALLGMLLASGLRKLQTAPVAKEESLAVLADRLEDQAETIANRVRRFEAELAASGQELARQKAATDAAEKHNQALQEQITRLKTELGQANAKLADPR
jgi:septal ring factor EnvC (AmiA/AmiB activator)